MPNSFVDAQAKLSPTWNGDKTRHRFKQVIKSRRDSTSGRVPACLLKGRGFESDFIATQREVYLKGIDVELI